MSKYKCGGPRIVRAVLSLAALGVASGAVAQTAPVKPPADTVGPGELRDFSLGNRTAPATPPPVQPDLIATPRRIVPRATTSDPVEFPLAAPRPRPASTTSPTVRVEVPTVDLSSGRAPPPRAGTRPADAVTVALAPVDPMLRRPTPAGEADVPIFSGQSTSAPTPFETSRPRDRLAINIGGLWPWLIGLMVLVGATLAWALRGRRSGAPYAEPALAGGPPVPARDVPQGFVPTLSRTPQPEPATRPAARIAEPAGGITIKRPDAFADHRAAAPSVPAPSAAPPRPVGIVSTRLRPWLDLSFEPSRAVIDEAHANVSFDVVVTNSGSAPARQVLVEACMINAGPEQDIELKRFFDAPAGAGERIEAIPPLGKVQLNSAVSLPLNQVRAYEVEGRKLFVPLIAFNALYEWGSNEGQSSAAFLLGRGAGTGDSDSDAKMAPLRLDLGPRVFSELDSRRHSLGLRR